MKYAALTAAVLAIIYIRRRRPDPDLVELAGRVGCWWEEAVPG